MILPAEDEDFEALLLGKPIQDLRSGGRIAPDPVIQMLRDLANRIRATCDPAAWWMVEADEVVGLCSITSGPSAEGVIDIGYGVSDSHEGRGVAIRAVGEVLKWARLRSDLTAVTAETSIHNPASQRVLERNGFVRTGARTDAEDGDLICWRIPVAS